MTRRDRILAAVFASGLARSAMPLVWRVARGMTLGVRIAVFDGERVLLVRHGYTEGWHLPGGGIERGETALQAAARELVEETGCIVIEPPTLAGLFFNPKVGRRDHVALFVCRSFRQGSKPAPSAEIAESGFFPRDELPKGTTKSTRRRLAELLEGAEVSAYW